MHNAFNVSLLYLISTKIAFFYGFLIFPSPCHNESFNKGWKDKQTSHEKASNQGEQGQQGGWENHFRGR